MAPNSALPQREGRVRERERERERDRSPVHGNRHRDSQNGQQSPHNRSRKSSERLSPSRDRSRMRSPMCDNVHKERHSRSGSRERMRGSDIRSRSRRRKETKDQSQSHSHSHSHSQSQGRGEQHQHQQHQERERKGREVVNKEKDGEHHDKELRQDQEIEKEESDVAIREGGDGSVREELGEMVKSNSITLTPSLQDSKKSEPLSLEEILKKRKEDALQQAKL